MTQVIAKDILKLSQGKISRTLSRLEEITVRGYGIKLRSKSRGLTEIFEKINEKYERVVVAFDEAQYLRFARTDFTLLLAWIYDNLQNLVIVLTGS